MARKTKKATVIRAPGFNPRRHVTHGGCWRRCETCGFLFDRGEEGLELEVVKGDEVVAVNDGGLWQCRNCRATPAPPYEYGRPVFPTRRS